MFQPVQIKKEPIDGNGSKKKKSKKNSELQLGTLNCTCKKSNSDQTEPPVQDNNKKRQILVNFGLTRKKVFTLCSKDDKLLKIFTSYVLSEPAFSKLLKDSYVVFQEFSDKFGTWVDIDKDDFIKDGSVLKAVFFPISIERDESNPGSIKRKETEQIESKKSCNDINIIDLSSSQESDSDETNSSKRKNSSLTSEKHKIVKKRKKKKSKNVKEIEQSSNEKMMSGKEDAGKSKKATTDSTTKVSGTESNHNQPNSFNSTSQRTPMKGNEADVPTHSVQQESFLPCDQFKYSAHNKSPKYNNYKSYNHQKSQGKTNYRSKRTYYSEKTYNCSETYENNEQYTEAHYEIGFSESDPLQPVQKMCKERNWPAPEVTAERHPHGWTCKLWVRGLFYLTRHADLEFAKKKAAEKAVNELASANSDFFHSNGYTHT